MNLFFCMFFLPFIIGFVICLFCILIIKKETADKKLAVCQMQVLNIVKYYMSETTLEAIIIELELNDLKYFDIAYKEGIVTIGNLIKKSITRKASQ